MADPRGDLAWLIFSAAEEGVLSGSPRSSRHGPPMSPPPVIPHDPFAAPTRDFWLDELRVARFATLVDLLNDLDALAKTFEPLWRGKVNQETLKSLFPDFADSPELRLNLVLLAEFIEGKQTNTLKDVARSVLGDAAFFSHPALQGRGHRLSIALLVYAADCHALVGVDLYDQWHPRQRCAMKVKGNERELDLLSTDWQKAAPGALAAMTHGGANLVFDRALKRAWVPDVLLAFRNSGAWDVNRGVDGRIQSGQKDDWTFIRVFEKGHRLHLTAFHMDRAMRLASCLAWMLWSKKSGYKPARDPLSRDRLDEFLRRLTQPSDDTFRLLELTAEVPGRWRDPVIRVGNTGRERVEHVVHDLRGTYPFARDSRRVHKVKLGFIDRAIPQDPASERHYRIELHFPYRDCDENDLVLEYGDRGGEKDRATRFEELMKREIGVDIHPKAPTKGGRQKRRTRFSSKPPKLTPLHWGALLASRVDDPADWQIEQLAWMKKEGIVDYTESTVFRCGDPRIPRRHRPGASSLTCSALVVMPFGRPGVSDPFEQDPGAVHTCDDGVHEWKIDRFKPPVWHRVEVAVDPAGAWSFVCKTLCKKGVGFEVDEGGVLSRIHGGRQYVVFTPLAKPQFTKPSFASTFPVCWIVLTEGELGGYGDRAVTLASFLARSAVAVREVLKLGIDARTVPLLTAGTPPASAVVAPIRKLPDVSIHLVQPGDDCVYVGGLEAMPTSKQRIMLLFALLQAVTDREAASSPRLRGMHTAQKLTVEDPDNRIEAHHIHDWVHRARGDLDQRFPEQNIGQLLIHGGGKNGYRVGPAFQLSGFDLRVELAAYKASPRKRRK